MKNKGFTLVELLAVILILIALAALITPKVFKQLKTAGNITEQEQINSLINISKIYTNQHPYLLPEENNISSITIEELKQSELIKSKEIINPNTNEELTGCVLVKNENNKYKYEYSETSSLCNLTVTTIADNVKYYDTQWIKSNPIYFDPINGNCTETDYNNNENKLGKTGCMKWYAYSENNDGTVNMILDHNTTATIPWNQSASNVSGPSVTFLYQLYSDTENWTKANNRTASDNYSISNSTQNYTIDYTNHYASSIATNTTSGSYKARLITAEEVANITGNTNWTINDISFYFGSLSSSIEYSSQSDIEKNIQKKNSWLFNNTWDCIDHGCDIAASSNNGYWTASPSLKYSSSAFFVFRKGSLGHVDANQTVLGIRPVITVNKNYIFE